MKYFPDEPANAAWARYAVAILPLFYLAVALLYSANSAPWGRQVDPESAYAMNGLAFASGFPMMKNDHPGTTTILLAGIVVKLWALLSGRSDTVEFGLRNYDAFIYASRAAEALILSGGLLAAGFMVRNAARSSLAAMVFQIAPFVSPVALHFEVMLIPESLMASCAIFGMGIVLKAALDERPPTVGLGAALGLIFALGLSSKYLYLPLAFVGLCFQRSWRASAAAWLVGIFGFFLINRILNPLVFTSGYHWLVSLATHKGIYGEGEPGFIDFNLFWSNMATIITASPLITAVFLAGVLAALARMLTSGRYLDPISLTLVACFLAFAAQLVATSKHFNLHYMMASWALTGGVLVLTVIEVRRLFPNLSPRLAASVAAAVCAILLSTTLFQLTREARAWVALNNTGAKFSKAVIEAGPSCANVSGMFVRAPENEMAHGADMTLGTRQMVDRFSDAYARAFKPPLLDHDFYRQVLTKNFRDYSYPQLAAEYLCIVVRVSQELDAKSSAGLLELNPEHCLAEGIHIYTLGIACEKIRRAMQGG